MQADETDQVQGLLEAFVEDVCESLTCKDQRARSGLYVQGLMLEGWRKSLQPMGARLGVDQQQLQQFVSSWPWPVEAVEAVEPVRRALVRRAVGVIAAHRRG